MNVWRDRLSRWFTPLARRCPLSPNAVTLLALAFQLIAVTCLYRRAFLLALPFVIAGGFADAFDGIVARAQGKESRFGDFLDHFADRIADLALAAGWMLGSGVREVIAMLVLIAIMLNGYIGTQIEATWKVREYDTIGRGEFVLALIVFPIVSHILFANGWQRITGAGLTILEWMSLAMALFAVIGIAQRFGKAKSM
ncbi:MAG TPA: CDP-alcohol phosphatidyltransferase family protein [Thermoanaerobaculia bacterium]|nr:CDP-alcohol phosphatidyltransferase family protein [Thermoanaerobaculia bacterium]